MILNAANRDGGAHVDSRLIEPYKEISTDGFLGTAGGSVVTKDGENKGIQKFISKNAHLAAIRQIGYEILHSQDIRNNISNHE